jgi:hypothetical protein
MFAWRRETRRCDTRNLDDAVGDFSGLVYLSRVARPYALTCLLTAALMAFRAWWMRAPDWLRSVVAATRCAGWLPLSLCFVSRHFHYDWPRCAVWLRVHACVGATHELLRLTALDLATVLPLGAVLLPPLLRLARAAGKAGSGAMTWASAWRTLLMLFGVRALLSILLLALGGLGAVSLWRRERDLASGNCRRSRGAIIAHPAWMHHPGGACYLLPALPIVLLFVAEGTMAFPPIVCAACLSRRLRWHAHRSGGRRTHAIISTPNQFMAHALYQFDIDPAQNLFVATTAMIRFRSSMRTWHTPAASLT